MNKKAALELSINAIVVLILAITILGLGIGFIKNQFGSLNKRFTDVSAEIQSELVQKIRESGDLLVFNRAELTTTVGTKDTFYIGIKNSGGVSDPNSPGSDSACFAVAIKCLRPLKASNQCTPYQPDRNTPVVVGGAVPNPPDAGQPEYQWFQIFDQVDIKNNDVGVYPVYVQIAKATPDTYSMELDVYKGTGSCSSSPEFDPNPYQSKQFFVVLS
jgi:hypothetical protein